MTPDQIKRLVRSEMQASSAAARFQLSSIPRHSHNSVDSPFVFTPILTYIGLILIDGTIVPPAPGAAHGILPKGWIVEWGGSNTGDYLITHNLNSQFYTATASPLGTTTSPTIAFSKNVIEFTFFNTATQVATDTPFFFILTVINNKKTLPPQYEPSQYTL